MKTINLRDEDYEKLMKLSAELQKQDNHGQAFPYFWEPGVDKLVPNIHGEGDVVEIFHSDNGESFSPRGFAEHEYDLWNDFLSDRDLPEQPYMEGKDNEHEWVEYVKDQEIDDILVITSDIKKSTIHNPSLFLSDAQGYVEGNPNPRTYARTVRNMPKMKDLIEIIYRLNPQKEEEVNHEARRFVFNK